MPATIVWYVPLFVIAATVEFPMAAMLLLAIIGNF